MHLTATVTTAVTKDDFRLELLGAMVSTADGVFNESVVVVGLQA